MEIYHVIPNGNLFTLIKHGNCVPIGEYKSRSEALKTCVMLSESTGAVVKLHRSNGDVQAVRRIAPGRGRKP